MRLFVLFAAAMPLAAQCAFTFVPSTSTGVSVPAAGGSGTIAVTTNPPTCAWEYGANDSWITVGISGQGTLVAGNQSIQYTVAANLSPVSRQSAIVITDGVNYYSIPVTQQATSCTLTLPTTTADTVVGGGYGTFQVQTACYWNVYGISQTWITVPTTTSGTGSGSVNYSLTANPCVASRSGTIIVQMGSLTPTSAVLLPTSSFVVTEDGSNSNLAISPTSAALPAAGGTGTIQVTTGNSCSWGGVYSTASWITLSSQGAGNGSGVLGYTVVANTSTARTGTIAIGPQTFTITQAAAPPPSPQVNAVLNAASYATSVTAVAPGEIVALFGANMGPATGVGLQLNPDGKSVSTTLGGTQVLFDGVAAPLTFARADQVNAVVPFGVSGSTKIQVAYQTATSTAVTMSVQAAAPGIFTLDGDGIGNGAILNQDYSINGKSAPAAIGSIVQIFCTGGGATNPATADGAITTAANTLVQQPVTVTIGGLNATVKYAGGAPGAIAGAVQINAVVPAGVTPGSSVPVVVQIGNWQSQPNVTVSVTTAAP
jgi:uncharacterized protein (TIGR03437 family)